MGYNREQVLERDDYICQKCGLNDPDGDQLEVHHRFPQSKEGSDKMHNLVTVCVNCHNEVHHDSKRSPRWEQSVTDIIREGEEWAEWAVENPEEALKELKDRSDEPLYLENFRDATKVIWKEKLRSVKEDE